MSHRVSVIVPVWNMARFLPDASLAEPPSLEIYTDLAELIAMDPVHEIDILTGWPKAPDPKRREA
jgi:hypothetical protein